MKLNTPTLWQQFRRRIGLPGTTRLKVAIEDELKRDDGMIDSTTVCRMAATWQQREPDAQELAEFGYPEKRRYHAEV